MDRIIDFFIRKFFKIKPEAYVQAHVEKKGKLGEVVKAEVRIGKEGGVFTKFENSPHAFAGFPDRMIVWKVCAGKKLIPLGVNWIWKRIKQYVPENPKLYSHSVREIHRWFTETLIARQDSEGQKQKFTKLRDVVCLIMEYDEAYRFPLQDALPELNLKEIEMDEADRYWARKKPYNFKGREETRKKYIS